MSERVSSTTNALISPNKAEEMAPSCCLWECLKAIFEWLSQIFCYAMTAEVQPLDGRVQTIEVRTSASPPSPIQTAVVNEVTPQPSSPVVNHPEEKGAPLTIPEEVEQVVDSPSIEAQRVQNVAEAYFSPPEKTFTKSAILIERPGEGNIEREVTSFEELETLASELDRVINGSHRTITIRYDYNGGLNSKEVRELWEYLEKHFEVAQGFNRQLILQPKVAKLEGEEVGDKFFHVTTYRNGVVLRLTPFRNHLSEGDKSFPAGILDEAEVVEKGIFDHTRTLCHGTRTIANQTVYILSLRHEIPFKPFLFQGSDRAIFWDGSEWKVGVSSYMGNSLAYTVDDTLTPFEWLMQNPTEDTIAALADADFSKSLTMDQKQKIIQSFITIKEGEITPVFHLNGYYTMRKFLRLAADYDVAVDFSLTHPETLQPLLIQWILSLTDTDEEDPFYETRVNEWRALLSQAGGLITQMAEDIFEDLVAKERFFLSEFVQSDWTFKDPIHQLLYGVLKTDFLDETLFNDLSNEKKREIYRLASNFKKFHAAERIQALAGDLVKETLNSSGEMESDFF